MSHPGFFILGLSEFLGSSPPPPACPLFAAATAWPVVACFLAIAMVFSLVWMQARHRRNLSRDIGERRRVETALREKEQLLKSITDNLSEGIYRSSADRGLIFANKAYLQMFGYQSFEEMKDISRDRLYFSVAERARLQKLLDSQGAYSNQEIEYVRKDGSRFWGLASSIAVRESDGGPVQYHVGAITDITESKHAQALLREKQELSEARSQELQQQLESRVRQRTHELVQANEQLKMEIRERRRHEKIQKALFQISEAIHTTEDLESLYQKIHEVIKTLMKAENFYLVLQDPSSGLHYYAYHVDQIDPKPGPRKMESGLNGYVLNRRKALLADAKSMTDPKNEWSLQGGSPSAIWLGVPLLARNQAFGVMAVQDYDNPRAYGEEEQQILTFVAEQTVLAIERKAADQELRESEEKHRALFEASSQGVILHDENEILEINPAALRILEYGDSKQVLGKHPADTSAPIQPGGESAHALASRHMRATLEKGSTRFEWVARTATGKDVPMEVVLTAIQMRGRKIIQAVINDISQRKKAESELMRRTEQIQKHRNVLVEVATMDKSDFREALKKICELSAVTLDVARVSYWFLEDNSRSISCELLVLGPTRTEDKEFAGTRLSFEECPEYFHALASKQPIAAHNVHDHPATFRLCEGYLIPMGINSMLDAPVWFHGEVVGVLCHEHVGPFREWTTEEISFASSLGTMVSLALEADQRSKSESALRQSHREIKTLLETLPGYAFFKDRDGKYIMANQNLCEAIGVSRDFIAGKTDYDLFPAELAEKFRADDQRLVQSGERLYVGEEQMVDHGRQLLVETQKVPVMDDHGNVTGLIGLAINITKRKNAEEELLKAVAREKELSQLKTSFVSTVSHEFRTPLGIILSSAQILSSYLDRLDEEQRREHLLSIQNNVRHMASLMEEVLVLSRVDSGKMNFDPAPVDLKTFLPRIADEVSSANNRHCEIRLNFAADCTEAVADEKLLRHIFINLLSNAVKYSPVETAVDFSITRDQKWAVCVVEDHGIGIPEHDREWLFEAFHRGRNVGERPGTGLGLTIVKRCLELHGGQIQLESEVGRGTKVTVRLPLFAAADKTG